MIQDLKIPLRTGSMPTFMKSATTSP